VLPALWACKLGAQTAEREAAAERRVARESVRCMCVRARLHPSPKTTRAESCLCCGYTHRGHRHQSAEVQQKEVARGGEVRARGHRPRWRRQDGTSTSTSVVFLWVCTSTKAGQQLGQLRVRCEAGLRAVVESLQGGVGGQAGVSRRDLGMHAAPCTWSGPGPDMGTLHGRGRASRSGVPCRRTLGSRHTPPEPRPNPGGHSTCL
jgi:hypothetical protein